MNYFASSNQYPTVAQCHSYSDRLDPATDIQAPIRLQNVKTGSYLHQTLQYRAEEEFRIKSISAVKLQLQV